LWFYVCDAVMARAVRRFIDMPRAAIHEWAVANRPAAMVVAELQERHRAPRLIEWQFDFRWRLRARDKPQRGDPVRARECQPRFIRLAQAEPTGLADYCIPGTATKMTGDLTGRQSICPIFFLEVRHARSSTFVPHTAAGAGKRHLPRRPLMSGLAVPALVKPKDFF
jgi:hypothetical protein